MLARRPDGQLIRADSSSSAKRNSHARRLEPGPTRRRANAARAAAGAGRRGHRQDARRHLSHRRADPPRHEAGAHSGRHVHQKGGRRNAASGPATLLTRRSPRRARDGAVLARDVAATPEISTFHSLCVRILRRHIERLGYPQKFVICDRSEQESQARAALRELRAPNAALAPGDLLAIVSRWKAARVRPDQAADVVPTATASNWPPPPIAAIRTTSSASAPSISTTCCCSPRSCSRSFRAVRRAEAKRFDHVLIDEYQDTNRSQYRNREGARRRASQLVRRRRR